MSENKDWSGLIIGGVLVGFVGLVVLAQYQADKVERIYTTIASGKFSHSEYHKSSKLKRVPLDKRGRVWLDNGIESEDDSHTIIYLDGGSSFIQKGLRDVLFSKGDMIEIKEDQFGQRLIVKM